MKVYSCESLSILSLCFHSNISVRNRVVSSFPCLLKVILPKEINLESPNVSQRLMRVVSSFLDGESCERVLDMWEGHGNRDRTHGE